MGFVVLPTAGSNSGVAYVLVATIGDCFCDKCGMPIIMGEAKSGEYFHGQCRCGAYVEATICLATDGRSGVWVTHNR